MTFFLDFDRTIYNFDSFYTRVIQAHPLLKEQANHAINLPSGSSGRQEFYNHIGELITLGKISFPPKVLAQHLFPDALRFLEVYGEQSVIVTYGNEVFQRTKVEGSLGGVLISKTIYVSDTSKGETINNTFKGTVPEGVFIDDSPSQLESVKAYCPHLRVFEIRRDNNTPTGLYPVIHNFSELESLI